MTAKSKFVLAWLVLGLAIALFLGNINWLRYARLTLDGVSTNATVTEAECRDHNSVRYTFSYQDRTFSGAFSDSRGCSALRPGEKITAYFLEAAPGTNTGKVPLNALLNETAAVALAALVVPPFLIWLVMKR